MNMLLFISQVIFFVQELISVVVLKQEKTANPVLENNTTNTEDGQLVVEMERRIPHITPVIN